MRRAAQASRAPGAALGPREAGQPQWGAGSSRTGARAGPGAEDGLRHQGSCWAGQLGEELLRCGKKSLQRQKRSDGRGADALQHAHHPNGFERRHLIST